MSVAQYLNNNTELVKYVLRNHPELRGHRMKTKLWEKCCEVMEYKISPETIFRIERSLREDKQMELEAEYRAYYSK